jgi:hypothetical protein
MPNNKEYQDAYNKRYYQAQKEYLNWVRGCYKKTPKPKKAREPKPVVVEPYIEPERKDVIEIKTGNFLIEW